jgi:protein TonB
MIAASALINLAIYSAQIAIVTAVASTLPSLLRLDNPGARYAYWRAIGLLCIALPWIQPYHEVASTLSGTTDTVVIGVAAGLTPTDAVASAIDWASVVWAVLAAGVLLRSAWLAAGLFKLRQLRRSAVAAATLVDDDLQRTLGTRADVRHAAIVDHPVTFGLRKPVVLLPLSLQEQHADIRRAVVGHELVHVTRRDWAWLIVEEAIVCLFWFHPAVWWLVSRVQLAREEVVDELAILLTGRRKAYVEALLAFSDSTSVLPIAAFAGRRHLSRRIALVTKEDVMSSRRIVASCAAMALVVIPGTWYTVSALPLRASLDFVQQQAGPGPLEQRAHAVTPANPIPRRVHAEDPVSPDIPSVKGATVVVRTTIDEVGRVVEARANVVAIRGAEFTVSLTNAEVVHLEGTLRNLSADTAATVRQAVPAFSEAALRSVRQWRYDSPASGPLVFDVPVRFGTQPEVVQVAPEIMEFKAGPPTPRVTVRTFNQDALRVGGAIKAPQKVLDVKPVYPPIALASRVSGVVIIEARIGADGAIEDARVLRSIPLLDEAALDAVRQWRFTPTLLNGQAVPIMMTMTVNFTLDGKR